MSQLLSLASPAFFDVLPAREMMAVSRGLLRNYRDGEGFAAARSARRERLGSLSVDLQDERSRVSAPVSDPAGYAQDLLALYFHQLWSDGPLLLDLRGEAVHEAEVGLTWRPSPLWMELDAGFVQSLRTVYRGFYGDDDAMFTRGLAELRLDGAKALFRQYFGDDPRAVRFQLKGFISSFEDIFNHCRAEGIAIPRDFVYLGIYLATMYDNLNRFDIAVDVVAAFRRATDLSAAA